MYGYTSSTENLAKGVYGVDAAGSGETYGVHGETFSGNGNAAGGIGETSGSNSPAVRARGDLYVKGSASMNEVAINVYLSSDVSVNYTQTQIVFDQKRHDELGDYDTSTCEFRPARDGDYLVTAHVDWDGGDVSSGDPGFLFVNKYGSSYVTNNSASDGGVDLPHLRTRSQLWSAVTRRGPSIRGYDGSLREPSRAAQDRLGGSLYGSDCCRLVQS